MVKHSRSKYAFDFGFPDFSFFLFFLKNHREPLEVGILDWLVLRVAVVAVRLASSVT